MTLWLSKLFILSVAKVTEVVDANELFTATSYVISKVDTSLLAGKKELMATALTVKANIDAETAEFAAKYKDAYYLYCLISTKTKIQN